MTKRIAVIDICGTLFDSNTTFDFLDYFIHSRKYRCFRKVTNLFIWRVLNKAIKKICAIDVTRTIALKSLRGYSKQQLYIAAEQFYDNVLIDKIQCPIRKFVEELRNENYDLTLVSATLDCIASIVAKKWSIESFYSSMLSYNNIDICEGSLQKDLLGRKIEYLRQVGIVPPYCMVLTDDFSDVELLQNSKECVVVTKKCKVDSWTKYLEQKGISNYQLIEV